MRTKNKSSPNALQSVAQSNAGCCISENYPMMVSVISEQNSEV